MTERNPQNQDKFILRLPDGMRGEIKALAEENKRSMNAEIVARLEASIAQSRNIKAALGDGLPGDVGELKQLVIELREVMRQFKNR